MGDLFRPDRFGKLSHSKTAFRVPRSFEWWHLPSYSGVITGLFLRESGYFTGMAKIVLLVKKRDVGQLPGLVKQRGF